MRSIRNGWAPGKAAVAALPSLVLLVMLVLAGCSSPSGSSTGTTSGNATATTTATTTGATATATSAGSNNPQNCQAIAGFGSATQVSNDGRLAYVPFPSQAGFMTQGTDVVNSTGLYEVFDFAVCMPSSTVSGIHSYYANSQGWKQSSTYPYDGGYQAPCGDPYCWTHTDGPVFDYLSLENVHSAGNGFVTYGLRLAWAPTVPDCNNILPPGNPLTYHFFWDGVQSNVPVPPLTVEGLGDGHGVGSKTVTEMPLCSPGTASSVSAYMSHELGKHGWSATSQNLCGTTGWVINSAGLAISWQVSDPTHWTLSSCQ